MIIDASSVARAKLAAALRDQPDILVVAAVGDPPQARRKVLECKPDVIVLDLELPRDGSITFLRVLRIYYPVPVIVCGNEAAVSGTLARQAVEAGAVEVVCKPAGVSQVPFRNFARQIGQHIRAARFSQPVVPSRPRPAAQPGAVVNSSVSSHHDYLVAIGASTGGTEALKRVLMEMPANAPGTVIVQHMPVTFTASFANRLNELCAMNVSEAQGGERVLPGTVLVAPGDQHMMLRRSGGVYSVSVKAGPPVNRHRPSVEVLFQSVAKYAGRNAVGVMLTGMGGDGAEGMKCMRDAGAHTIGQDEATCVVYGMPKEAMRAGAVIQELPLEKVATAVLGALR